MSSTDPKTLWDTYCAEELLLLGPILRAEGIVLDGEQKHMQGERYLMQAVTTTSGKKLILTGKTSEGLRLVIKATRDTCGMKEIENERRCRELLTKINFAGSVFHTPKELFFLKKGGFIITAQAYIDQEKNFLDRPLIEQFDLSLQAFKAQESAHATTAKHRASIVKTFGIRTADTYLKNFKAFMANAMSVEKDNAHLCHILQTGLETLTKHTTILEQYTGFLTHTDFVPHNIRIHTHTIYLLDYSSLAFGNKYEGWARFLNFMTLYNPPLTEALTTYVEKNRSPEESVSLRMMRIYRLGEIIWYYTATLEKSIGNLRTLNATRVQFWSTVLSHVLKDEPVPKTVIEKYTQTRDVLRSEDEKNRQEGLH